VEMGRKRPGEKGKGRKRGGEKGEREGGGEGEGDPYAARKRSAPELDGSFRGTALGEKTFIVERQLASKGPWRPRPNRTYFEKNSTIKNNAEGIGRSQPQCREMYHEKRHRLPDQCLSGKRGSAGKKLPVA